MATTVSNARSYRPRAGARPRCSEKGCAAARFEITAEMRAPSINGSLTRSRHAQGRLRREHAMDFFDWWPFEVLIIGQMSLGLILIVGFSFVKGPADQLTSAQQEAELQLQKLAVLTKRHAKVAEGAERAA
jgi:hypothetical protein